jgi:hypothetical protein
MDNVNILCLRAAATVTATDTGTGVSMEGVEGDGHIILNSSATNTAGNTSTVKLQHSNDNGATDPWTDTGVAFNQVTNAAASFQTQFISLDQFKQYVRVVNTLAGTSPSVTYGVEVIGTKH